MALHENKALVRGLVDNAGVIRATRCALVVEFEDESAARGRADPVLRRGRRRPQPRP
jgi:hypothetical protein